MSDTIEAARVRAYEDSVHHLSQQNMSLLESRVRIRTGVVGKVAMFERLSPSNMILVSTRHGDTVWNDIAHTRRAAFKKDYSWSQPVDEEDKLEVMISPEAEYAIAAAAAVGRRIDQTIVDAISGTASTGEDGDGSQALPAAQKETTATGNTLAKMTASLKILYNNAVTVTPQDVTYVTNPAGLEDVLNLSTFTSNDFGPKALVPGQVSHYLGMTWIMMTDAEANSDYGILPEVTTGVVGTYLFHRRGVGLATWKRVSASIDKRADKNNTMQVLVKTHIGAVRVEDVLVVENQITN